MTLRLKMITDEQSQQFHEASLKILSEKGIRFFRQEAVDLLKEQGAKADGNLIRIPKALVEKANKVFNKIIKHSPETLLSPDQEKDVEKAVKDCSL